MGTIASTCLYNTAKTASNFGHYRNITRYQVVPKRCFWMSLNIKKKKKKDNIPFIAFMVLQGENRRWNVFWLAQHIKACIKTKIETKQKKKKQLSSGSHLCSVSNKKNWIRMIYIEREIEVYFYSILFTCFNVASTCYKRAELKYPREIKNTPNFCFLRTIKSREELTEYSNPLKQEAPDK